MFYKTAYIVGGSLHILFHLITEQKCVFGSLKMRTLELNLTLLLHCELGTGRDGTELFSSLNPNFQASVSDML